MKIDIVGGGPAGSYTAYLLAKKGHSVNVYERNSNIGKPVQCTGILSEHFTKIILPQKKFVVNTINKTRIYAPNGKYVEVPLKTNYVICRNKFDNYLADLAKKQGVKYYLNHSFKSCKQGKIIISTFNNKNKTITSKADILIGADGPQSQVAKSSKLFNNRNFIVGTQVEAKTKHNNLVEFYPYIGSYAWIVPTNKDTARIGVSAYKDSKKLFDNFSKNKLGKVIENQSGVIPVFNPKVKAQKNNIYLIGDAATFVKATSGGGINQSLIAVEILADCIHNNKNYQKAWKKKLFQKLYVHLLAHKMLEKFTNKDWNYLIKEFSDNKIKNILSNTSRDNIIKIMIKIIFTKPILVVKYAKYFPFSTLF